MIRVEYPAKLVSVLNAREHHMAKARRVKRERQNAALMLAAKERPALPVAIVVTRIAPRALDTHDNLGASAKAVIDSVCEWLGVKDNDPRVSIDVRQEKPKTARTYAVRIEVAHVA